MSRWVIFLKGVNVGGHKKVKSAELKAAAVAAGLDDVSTYIQSGNLLVSSKKPAAEIARVVEERLMDDLGLQTRAIVRTRAELKATLDRARAFAADIAGLEAKLMHVAFLSSVPTARPKPPDDEVIALFKAHAFIYYASGSARSKLTVKWLEKNLDVEVATARNLNTTSKIMERL